MDNTDKTCLVCHEAIEIFAVGKCDHPICFKCSTRMRGLCDQLYCPICRTDLPEVFFLSTRERFSDMPVRKFIQNRKLKIQFENENIRQKFEDLLSHRCKLCPDRYPDRSFKALQDHMRRVHTLFFCDLCLSLKIFSFERKSYNRQELASHRRMGDKDDTSYKGHPLCKFCDERYLDKDELYKHLRKDHYFCHFCESLGSQDFFQDYNNLRDHFGTDHYLCEEGDCINKQFTNAFRSEIDIKAHRATFHSKAQSKFQSRQERTLNIDINLVPRPTNRGRGAANRENYEEARTDGGGRRHNAGPRKNYTSKREKDDIDRAVQASLSTMTEESMKKDKKDKQPEVKDKAVYVNDIESFPTLNDTATTTTTVTTTESSSLANKFAISHNMSVQHGGFGNVEDFPTLTKSSSGSDLGNIAQPVTNYQPLKISQTSSKSAKPFKTAQPQPQKQSQPKKSFSNSTAFSDKVDDFPELPKALKGRNKSAVASSSWESIGQAAVTESVPNPSNISFITAKPSQPEPKRVKSSIIKHKYDDNDFPSLGGPIASSQSGPTQWFKSSNNNSKKNTKLQEDSSSDSGSDLRIIDRYSPVNIPDSPERDKKTKGNKKKKKNSANPKENIKRENAKNSLKENSSLDNIASLLLNSVSPPSEDKESNKDEIEPIISVPEVPVPLQKKQKAKANNVEKKMKSLHLEDEPRSVEQVEKKDPVKFVIADEFPSLGGPAKPAKKPPPGFKKETQTSSFTAPPGFTQQVSNKPPPGFVSQSMMADTKADENEVGKFTPMSSNLVNFEYAQPDGFSQRNKDLIGVIQSCCEDPNEFAEFKRFSGEFRRSDIGAQLYYEQCEELLGNNNFSDVFPELLALLPDIPKQQELLSVYMVKNGLKKDDKVVNISGKPKGGKGAWKPSQSGFLACITCRQVLVRKDYNAHVSIHNLDSDFPSLSGESSVAKSGLGSYGSWVKAK